MEFLVFLDSIYLNTFPEISINPDEKLQYLFSFFLFYLIKGFPRSLSHITIFILE
jgi:hypothetical protein